jgi:hypothetical protein
MREIVFALVREGTSDDGLVSHIRSLMLKAGAESALGTSRTYAGTTAERLAKVVAEDPAVDLVFVHRDADSRDASPRYREIEFAAGGVEGWEDRVIPIVPVQELEAWLLVDEGAIRQIVGKPTGRSPLGLPRLASVETTASPKEVLREACLAASETRGARHRALVKSFPSLRARLLDRLDLDGPVATLPSWKKFIEAVEAATIATLTSKYPR